MRAKKRAEPREEAAERRRRMRPGTMWRMTPETAAKIRPAMAQGEYQ